MSVSKSIESVQQWVWEMGWAVLLRRAFALGVMGLLAFVMLPSRSAQAQAELVLSVITVLGAAVPLALLAFLLWAIWRNE